MNLKQWLDQERGRHTALAAHLNVSVGRVSQMRAGGVPDKYKFAVRDFTSGVVSLESMVEARTRDLVEADPTLETQMAEAAKAGLIERRTVVRRADDRKPAGPDIGETGQGG